MKKFFLLCAIAVCNMVSAQEYQFANNISYTTKTDSYSQERLLLDVYYTEDAQDLPVVIWFHGGGLTSGEKEVPYKLKGKDCVLVGVNYRLLPTVTIDQTIDDAAEAVA